MFLPERPGEPGEPAERPSACRVPCRDAQLLVDDRPDRTVGAPRLEHHRPLVERLVDRASVIRGRGYLGHRAGLLVGDELKAGVGVSVVLLLGLARPAVVALAN